MSAVAAFQETLNRVEFHDGATPGTLELLVLPGGRRFGRHAIAALRRIPSRTGPLGESTGRS
jgi:hypothetical protein